MTVANIHKDPEKLTMTVTTELAATVERAWQLWADPRQLERWWGPPTYPATVVDHDLTAGGRVSYFMTGPEGDKAAGWWQVLAVEPPHRLELLDGFADDSGTPNDAMPTMTMTVTLREHDGGTVMTVETTFPSLEAMEQLLAMGMEEGIAAAVGQIDEVLGRARHDLAVTFEHADYDRIEKELNDAVAVSLGPRGPDVLYDVIADLGLAEGASAIDVGCGRGRQAVELARRSTFAVLGIDPLPRFEEVAETASVTFRIGNAEAIPAADASADLILYRELLYVVDDVTAVLTEGRRVLKPDGRAIVYQLFNTDWLEPGEAVRFWGDEAAARKANPQTFEASVTAAGLVVDDMVDLRSETVEWAEEDNGKAGRELLAAARLLRDPDRYISRFGREAYDIKVNDAFWFVYRMIGKLTQRIYVLRPTPRP